MRAGGSCPPARATMYDILIYKYVFTQCWTYNTVRSYSMMAVGVSVLMVANTLAAKVETLKFPLQMRCAALRSYGHLFNKILGIIESGISGT